MPNTVPHRVTHICAALCWMMISSSQLWCADTTSELIEKNVNYESSHIDLFEECPRAMSRHGDTRAISVQKRSEIIIVHEGIPGVRTLKCDKPVEYMLLSDDGRLLIARYDGNLAEMFDISSLKSLGIISPTGQLLWCDSTDEQIIYVCGHNESVDVFQKKRGEKQWQSKVLKIGERLGMCRGRLLNVNGAQFWQFVIARSCGEPNPSVGFDDSDLYDRHEFSLRSLSAIDLSEVGETRVLGEVPGRLCDDDFIDEKGSLCVLTATKLHFLAVDAPDINGARKVSQTTRLLPAKLSTGALGIGAVNTQDEEDRSKPLEVTASVAGILYDDPLTRLIHYRISEDECRTSPSVALAYSRSSVAMSKDLEFIRLFGEGNVCDYQFSGAAFELSLPRLSFEGVRSFFFESDGLVYVNCDAGCILLKHNPMRDQYEVFRRMDLKCMIGATPDGRLFSSQFSATSGRECISRIDISDGGGTNVATIQLPGIPKDWKYERWGEIGPVNDLRLSDDRRRVWFGHIGGETSSVVNLENWKVHSLDVDFTFSALQLHKGRYLSGVSLDSSSQSGKWSVVDLVEGRLSFQFPLPVGYCAGAPEPIGDGKYVFEHEDPQTEGQSILCVLDEQGKVVHEVKLPKIAPRPEVFQTQSFVVLPVQDQKLVGILEKTEGIFYLMTTPDLKIIHQLRLKNGDVTAAGVSPSKAVFFLGYEDGTVQTVQLRYQK